MTDYGDRAPLDGASRGDGGRAAPDPVAGGREARRRSKWRPRCSKCGRFERGSGGSGFGDGEWYCETCALRADLARGDGSTR